MVAASTPISVELEQGKEYFYCACGRSADQPFCDGSHQGTRFAPLAFVAETSGTAVLCRCKQTATPPYCDGSHSQVPADRVGSLYSVHADEPKPEPVDAMPTPQPAPEEPNVALIHELAEHRLDRVGLEGPLAAMGVPRSQLPLWDDIQIQLARQPLPSEAAVGTELVIGPMRGDSCGLRFPCWSPT